MLDLGPEAVRLNLAGEASLLTSDDLAAYLDKPIKTLDQWAYKRLGPKYLKIGRTRRYRWSDVDAWVDGQAAKTGE